MRACVQRVTQGRVVVVHDDHEQETGKIAHGLVVLLGVAHEDTDQDAEALADKIVRLRIFNDDDDKMNRSLVDVAGALLVLSQFTLLADCRKGRRPSFVAAAEPEKAEALYEFFTQCVARHNIRVATGRFRAHMRVELVNDGPVTVLLDSKKTF